MVPVDYDDLMEAYMLLLDGSAGTDVFSVKEGDKRVRDFLWHKKEYVYEFRQTGKAGDMDTFSPTGRVFDYRK